MLLIPKRSTRAFNEAVPVKATGYMSVPMDGPKVGMTGAGIFDRPSAFLFEKAAHLPVGIKNVYGTFIDRRSPTKRRQRRGEKHVGMKIKGQRMPGFANYAGKHTNLRDRIRANDPPRGHMDKIAQAHDLRLAFSDSPEEVRTANRIKDMSMAELRASRTGNPINARIRFSEDAAHARRSLSSAQDRRVGERILTQLKQEGFGTAPAALLKSKIMQSLARTKRHGRPKKRRGGRKRCGKPAGGRMMPMAIQRVVRLLANRFMPMMIHRFTRDARIPVQKHFGGAIKTEFRKVVTDVLKKHKQQTGQGIGAVIGTAASILPSVIPVIKTIGQKVWGFFKRIFGRKKRGRGLVLPGSGLKLAGAGKPAGIPKIIKALAGDAFKFLKGASKKAIEKMSGRGIGAFFKNLFSGAVNLFKKIFRIGKKVAAVISPIVKKVMPIVKKLTPQVEAVLTRLRPDLGDKFREAKRLAGNAPAFMKKVKDDPRFRQAVETINKVAGS